MSTPIGNNLQKMFDDVRENAYKRGYLTAQMDLMTILKTIDTQMISPEQLLVNILHKLNTMGNLQTPPDELPKRAKKKKIVNE